MMPWRILLPAVVTGLALVAMFNPGLSRQRPLVDALVVVDITRSMNVRDMNGVSRLEFARDALRNWIASRPCDSRIGLAVFTERRSLTLFEPIEVCPDFAAIDGSLQGLDWRMAWEGDSLISKGLNHALARAAELGVALVFVTDGHEAPPLPYDGATAFRGETPGGIILGVGGDTPAPIPKFDDLGREIGFYEAEDLQHAPTRMGAPPPDATDRPGYHARNNPYGESDLEGSEHLSRLQGDYLRELAAQRGLGYAPLSAGPTAIERALMVHASARQGIAFFSLSPVIGAFACVLLAGLWAASFFLIMTGRKETS